MLDSEAVLLIDSKNLRHNIDWIKNKTETDFVCPMIKANGYGAGAVLIAHALRKSGIRRFGVARISEALELRQNQIQEQLLLFNHFTYDELDQVFELKVTPVISSFEQLEVLKKYLADKKTSASIHLEFDTGMNRLGFRVTDAEEIQKNLTFNIYVEGVFTHFLEAANWPTENQSSINQYNKFEAIIGYFPKAIPHIASSKTLLHEKGKIKYGLRPGLWLYGIEGEAVGLKSVLTLKAPIISIRKVSEGETVSYGGHWRAQKPSIIATIPVGYADGYSRRLMGKSFVLRGSEKADIVGAICMDYMMIDVSDLQQPVQVGDYVVVFGPTESGTMISIESLASMCDVIPYEFITGLSHRLKRQIKDI